MNNDAIEKIKKLAISYQAQLPEKFKSLTQKWNNYQLTNEKAQLAELIREAHTLAGTSGTYGYHLISAAAKDLEKLLMDIESGADNISHVETISNLLQDLHQLITNPPLQPSDNFFEFNIEETHKRKRILTILDDSEKEHYTFLNQFNFEVHYFNKVDTFLAYVRESKPTMLIMNVSLAQAIPAEAFHHFLDDVISIVYMDDKNDLLTRLFTVRHGGQAFIVKPFDPRELIRTVDNLFAARESQNERVLIVDDSEHLAEFYHLVLEQAKMICKTVTDPRDFLTVIEEFQPDLILMDVNMPICSGVELGQIAHQQENLSTIPIIFLSTISEKSKQLEVLSIAGDDFLTKPIDPKHLVAAVKNRLLRSKILRSRIMRDSLTNLYNHTMIHHHLERELLIAERYQRPLSVVLLDIDHFKQINDVYGHQVGDKILKDLSLFLQQSVRKSDLVGRYGGEEFLLILPNTTPDIAFKVAEDLRERFSYLPHQIGDKEIYVTFSSGIADFPTFTDKANLIKQADEALYQAKAAGRNCIKTANQS